MKIKPLVTMSSPVPYSDLIALDIETASTGKLLDIGLYDGQRFQVKRDWHQFFTYLMKLRGRYRIMAHNGFGFDYIGLLQFLLNNFLFLGLQEKDITFLSSASLVIAVIIRNGLNEFTLIDTVRFFPGSKLDTLAYDFLNEHKLEVPAKYISRMEVYKKNYPTKYFAYLERDCTLLYRVYETFRDEINRIVPIGELGLSSGSTAMKCFRRHYHSVNPRGLIFAPSKELFGAADYALRGGFTAYIGDGKHDTHLYKDVNSYDVISMYPSIMRSIPVPTAPLRTTKRFEKVAGRVKPGWYLCEFKQTRGRVPIFYDVEASEPSYSGIGMLTHLDIEFLNETGSVKCLEGVVYDSFAYVFTDLMNQLLDARLKAKKDGLKAKATALKIVLNSLYGKFAQAPVREIIAITGALDLYESEIKASLHSPDKAITEYFITDNLVLYGYLSDSTSFSNRFIGAMITAYARLKIGIMANTYPSIYCDTDSLFTQDTLDDYFVSSSAGYFELDAQSPSEMICLGKKSYQYGDMIKFKGIPRETMRNNRKVPVLTSNHIEKIRQGELITTTYRTPTALKTALKKNMESPNRFDERHRTIKRGLSYDEKGLLRKDQDFYSKDFSRYFFDCLTFN